MKKVFSLGLFVLLSMFFLSSNSYAQNDSDLGQKNKWQLNKLFDLTGDKQFRSEDAMRVKKQIKAQDGSGECLGFIDEDGDGLCDNCGSLDKNGDGNCDGDGVGVMKRPRDRDSDGKGLLKRSSGN